jgi:hypothetical protein
MVFMVLAGCMVVCATDREMAPQIMFSQNCRGRVASEAPPRPLAVSVLPSAVRVRDEEAASRTLGEAADAATS